MGSNYSSSKRKIHSSKCLQKKKNKKKNKTKLERASTTSLTSHRKDLEQKEANTPRSSRWQDMIKLMAEVNQVETKSTTQE
jgi:hypothetical protein